MKRIYSQNAQVDTVKAIKLVKEISYMASNLTYMRSPEDIPGNISNKNEVFQNVKKFIQTIQGTSKKFWDSGIMQEGPRHDSERVLRNLNNIKAFAEQVIPYASMLRDNYGIRIGALEPAERLYQEIFG